MTAVFTYELLGRNGGLGNQLFQIAGTVGKALSNRGRPSFNSRWEYRSLFSIPDEYFQPPRKGELTIDGGEDFMQRLAEFEHCQDHIREILSPSSFAKDILRTESQKMPGLLNGVSLHVRRTDYVQLRSLFYYLEASYYESALQRLRAEGFSWEKVFLFSDDMPLASAELKSIELVSGETCTPSHLTNAWVLLTMSQMPYHVISNSTFSWWGAWLSGSRAVAYPSRWGVGNYAFQERVNTIIPTHWLKVEV